MENEIWKPVKNYEGYYEVSSYGRVKSLDRIINYSDGVKHLHKGRILKPYKDARENKGYLRVELKKDGIFKKFAIHRLVAQAFIQNPSNLPEVNHKDEVKTNNRVSNLEWCDGKYNVNYGTAIQRRAEKRSMSVLQIDKETNEIVAEYPSTMEAARQLNISQGNIWSVCNGTQKTYKGFKWQYKKE